MFLPQIPRPTGESTEERGRVATVLLLATRRVGVLAIAALSGLLEETYRLPLVPPSAAAREKVMRVLQNLKLGVHEHAR